VSSSEPVVVAESAEFHDAGRSDGGELSGGLKIRGDWAEGGGGRGGRGWSGWGH
jgi:hypothetical protein